MVIELGDVSGMQPTLFIHRLLRVLRIFQLVKPGVTHFLGAERTLVVSHERVRALGAELTPGEGLVLACIPHLRDIHKLQFTARVNRANRPSA